MQCRKALKPYWIPSVHGRTIWKELCWTTYPTAKRNNKVHSWILTPENRWIWRETYYSRYAVNRRRYTCILLLFKYNIRMYNLTTIIAQVTILLIPVGWEIPWVWVCWDGHGWAYYQDTKTILLCDNKENKGRNRVLNTNHEIGHYIHYNLITEKEWKSYQTEWAKSVKLGQSQFNRAYSMNNAMEWFADDVMYLMDDWYQSYLPAKEKAQRTKRIAIVKKILLRLSK